MDLDTIFNLTVSTQMIRTNMIPLIRAESYQSNSTVIRTLIAPSLPAKEELKSWSCYIRDTLSFRVVASQDVALDSDILDEAEEFLGLLKRASIDMETLRHSRVHNALEEICATGSKWPLSIVMTAEELLSQWESEFGNLKDIRGDLWTEGGRLAGIMKLEDWGKRCDDKKGKGCDEEEDKGKTTLLDTTLVQTKNQQSAWSVEGGRGPTHSLQAGHIGFQVGDWWIKRAAAYRDGIIHSSPHGITADENGAYAVLMTEGQEPESREDGKIKYLTSNKDPGCFKLMKNLASRQLVRVLRSYRLTSVLSPRAGIRYEGLYLIVGYAVKLTTNATGDDEWQYTFTFERHPYQEEMERALCHPTADEMDDFNDYKRMKTDWKDLSPISKNWEKRNIVDWILDSTLDSSNKGSADSGYFTLAAIP